MSPEMLIRVIRILVIFVLIVLHTSWVVRTFRPFDGSKAIMSLSGYLLVLSLLLAILYNTVRFAEE